MNVRLRHIMNWMEVAQLSNFNARTLAAKLEVSQSQLRRFTKKSFGRSPQAWLDRQRLVLAGEMLKDCISIKSLAFDLGYKTQAHFSRAFRQHYGLSPKAFRDCDPRQLANVAQRPALALGHAVSRNARSG